jgi:hypothetical protein
MPGIICLEGNWNENDLSKENSIVPVLQHLSINMNVKVIHKHCSTVEQLKYYFNLLSENRKYKGYGIIYLAFHGRSGNIYLDKHNHISLTELMQLSMENKKTKNIFDGRRVHFGCCTTLKNEKIAYDFLEQTGAKLITGFVKKVDFHDSTAFDMLFLGKLAYTTKYNQLIDSVIRNHENFTRELGFVSYSNVQ